MHDHEVCLKLAGDINRSPNQSNPSLRQKGQCNILMYVRKSDDVEEILESLKDSIVYIASKLADQPAA